MQFLLLSSFVIIIGCAFGHCQAEEETYWPRVVTPLGTIEGSYNTSSNGQLYEEYLGIPYALPPTGERRFKVAKPSTPWTGILTAKQFGSSCAQIEAISIPPSIYRVIGSEDCLYLNIYTPARLSRNRGTKTPSTDLLPVILFIHGGGFQMGSGAQYGPKYLLNNNIILVTINYRLGILGFMSTEDDMVPGNMGLKDQVMAMRWVSDNIVYFGGDPKKVTLVGHSAGGASVQFYYLTDITAGLFRQGMSISGTALDCWALTENPLEKARTIAMMVRCPSSDVKTMVKCLQNRPADEITLATVEFIPWLNNPFDPFGPVVEKGRSEFTIIGQPPIESLISGQVQRKPWITSVVSEDGLLTSANFVANATLLEQLNNSWYKLAPHLLDFNFTIPESRKIEVSQLIRKHYFGKRPINNSTVKQIIQIVSDRLYFYNAEKAARLQALAIPNLVRFYYLSYRGAHSFSETLSGTSINFGVSHLDDVAYVLNSVFDPTTTQEDRKMQKVLINLWVSYATNCIPDVGVKWPKLKPNLSPFQYLHIAGPNNIYMDESSNFGDKKFWLNIPFQENIFPKTQNWTGCKIQ